MVLPLTIEQQLGQMRFEPDEVITVVISLSKYDQVIKRAKSGKFVQFLSDMPAATNLNNELRNCFEKYGIKASRYVRVNPIKSDVVGIIKEIGGRIESESDRNFMIVWAIAG